MRRPVHRCQQSLFSKFIASRRKPIALRAGSLAALAAATVLFPLHAGAAGPAKASAPPATLRMMTDRDLSGVYGRAIPEPIPERIFERVSKYLKDGMAVEVLGYTALMLNPIFFLLGGDASILTGLFNAINPMVITDANGSSILRLSTYIEELRIENLRVRGSSGASYGEVVIRGINLNGTTIRVTRY